jgi:alkylated DNA repair dioxygenase AlkB
MLPLFAEDVLPQGLLYDPAFLSVEEHEALLAEVRNLRFADVRMHGVVARRRVAHFGWDYTFATRELTRSGLLPDYLLPLRERIARRAGREAGEFSEALVTEYRPGAAIGWHRDAPAFGVVAGVSLGSECRLRFRRTGEHGGWSRTEVVARPGSLYVLDGPARDEWQHSIPPVASWRYSITFRTVMSKRSAGRSGPADASV